MEDRPAAGHALDHCLDSFRPRARVRALDWCKANIQTADGRPYDHAAYPHIGNPGGPLDAFDCPQYLSIWLQWASRLGKTFFGQCAQMKTADSDPSPMMFASADQKLSVEVCGRTYKMLERCPALRDQLRPKHRRRQDLIDFDRCRIFIGWARSTSTLADKAVRVGHANEVDKWEHQSTSKEADPLRLFSDRFKEFASHKKIIESTPALKHTSRIERGRLASTNCAYWVPCPLCGRYQTLRLGDGEQAGGIVWTKGEAGKSEKELARRTARYICQHCKGELRDEHRGQMMRAGVWVPAGCGCDDAKARAAVEQWQQDGLPLWPGWKDADWVTGTPNRDGRDAGYLLSSLYALSLGWGDIAAEYLDSQSKPQNLRNFINQWLAETWEIVSRKQTWEQIGQRLIDNDVRRAVVPRWASIVTVGVDYQRDGSRYPYVVDAWGPDRRNATVAYGECDSLDELQSLINTHWQHADGGQSVRAHTVLIDSGHRPVGIYEFCERASAGGLQAFACKGSSKALQSDFERVVLGKNTSRPGTILYHIDTIRSQTWVERVIHDIQPDAPGGFTLHAGNLFEHQDFLQQLLNDAPVDALDSHNNATESWDRLDENMPNDLRDCKRYAYAAMLVATRNGRIYPRDHIPQKPLEQQTSRFREIKFRR